MGDKIYLLGAFRDTKNRRSCYAIPFNNPGDGKRYLLGMTENEERVPEGRQENDFKMPPSPEILGKPSVEDSESNASSLAAVKPSLMIFKASLRS